MKKNIVFKLSDLEIENLKKLKVKALVLFGSQAQMLAGPGSDFDIGVIMGDSKIIYKDIEIRRIYDYLYDLFSDKINQLKNIDIVFLEKSSAELQAHVMKHGKIIFEDSSNAFVDYKAKVMEQYSDFAPLRRIFHQGILNQIK